MEGNRGGDQAPHHDQQQTGDGAAPGGKGPQTTASRLLPILLQVGSAEKGVLPVDPANDNPPQVPLSVGDGVRLAVAPRYLKTADPMPMLRPPDLISADEVGQVLELRPGGALAVRFRRGTFLLAAAELRRAQPPG